ncbi:uncharacterized protein BDZ99DRAFT_528079 [Mytilinidion resinicola]|uniref:DUF6604 domain-containing protein n=1 Tax=Mytilinidion resinicola TaxID=574789 RepID=A0A6A6Y230_9PEZI|nr:uncharacterized protein BDZ99DRAFT_528079 [Mytilinidion resinicola]KAF2801867.1 hypothetical protein BDZ99DRAFT_528079 [Mytilinidion resinicola]
MASQGTTYERYKADTNLFTTWLGRAAKGCGWKPSSKPSECISRLQLLGDSPTTSTPTPTPTPEIDAAKGPRMKGKARKLAKEVAKEIPPATSKAAPNESGPNRRYAITTEELLTQVDVVATSRSSAMPDAIRKALSGAIAARQRCAAWFEKTNSGTRAKHIPKSLDGYQYFIGVLQRALNKLGVTTPAASSLGAVDKGENDFTFMRNVFEALEVEDISEEEATEALQPSAAVQSNRAKDLYELAVDANTEIAFTTFSLFEDIYRIRTELKQVWTQFRDGQIQLLQASVLTTAALELVDQAEKEVYRALLEYQQSDTKHIQRPCWTYLCQ